MKYILLFLSLITFNLLHAQSPTPTCPDSVVINSYITTYGYTYKETDTVLVQLYRKNTGFKKAFDSFYVYPSDVVFDTTILLKAIDIGNTRPIYSTWDWELVLKHKQTYNIGDVKTDMVLERHQFKRCKMVSYSLNGVKQTAQEIKLVKPGYKLKKVKTPKQPKGAKKRMIL